MIIIDLRCESGHCFEGWFASSESFREQQEHGMIVCAECGSQKIDRVPSAVHIGSAPQAASGGRVAVLPDSPLVLYRQLVSALLSASDDVGRDFANEARRIHYQETSARAIHGQSTPEEFEALRDEGIEVLPLPMLEKVKLN